MKIVFPNYPKPTEDFIPRPPTAITDIVIHHTAGPADQTPLEIDAFERGRGDIYMPYNYLIGPDGQVYSGRPDLCEGAATYGRNWESLTVCVIGSFMHQPPTDAAIEALTEVVVKLHRVYPSVVRTIGHRDAGQLARPPYYDDCPGDALYNLIPDIKACVPERKSNA